MSFKKNVLLMGVILFALVIAGTAFAGGDKKHGYDGSNDGLESKLMKKIGTALKNQEEIGLTDKQYDALKKIKIAVKKEIIKDDAEVDLLVVDIKAHLWEDEIDTAEVNKLIEKKYDIKKAKAKALVAAYAHFKDTLSEDQYKKMKELYRSKKCKKQ